MAKRDQKQSKQKARKEKLRKLKAQQKSRSTPGFSVTDSNLNEAMTAAVRLHQDGKLTDAARIYRQVIKLQPNHPDALSSLAMVESEDKRFERAIDLLQRAIELVGNNAGYYINLGSVFDEIGNLDDAETNYQRAIELTPEYPDPYYNLGNLYLKQGQAEAGIAIFDQCMAATGRDFHALAYKAHSLFDAGKIQDAVFLLDHGSLVKRYPFEPPQGYESIEALNQTLARHVSTHRSLQNNVRATVGGDHTGELLVDPKGPMAEMEEIINSAVAWYKKQLPDLPDHPFLLHEPIAWRLTAWGVVLRNKGHERSHIHPNGWLSGVFYVQLPEIISDPESEPQGWLEFGRPTKDLHVSTEPETQTYQPQYGNIILFPSYFYHGTIPFKSKEKRICISFDAEPIYQ
jgi:uncharacterized protein (TIGR02466 family)